MFFFVLAGLLSLHNNSKAHTGIALCRSSSPFYYDLPANQRFTMTFNVKDFGAKADDKTMDTKAINDAIGAASEVGGGIVTFPKGVYLTGTIRLKSNITLFLEKGCIVVASDNAGDYDKPENNPYDQYQDYGHSHWRTGLIWGESLTNISVEGPGVIYGKGLSRNRKGDKLPEGLGDKTISLKSCNNVTLRDFSILHGGHIGVLITGGNNIKILNLKIDTNRDGINIDCSKNVRITGCSINSPWNDAICLKSSYALGANISTEDVIISDCFVTGGYAEGALLDGTFRLLDSAQRPQSATGRIKLGSESNGGFKNIVVTNCVFDYSRGLSLTTVDGGDVEDISISNITMRHLTGPALLLRLGGRLRGPEGIKPGKMRRINISNIVADGAPREISSIISGIPGFPIEDISISNVMVGYRGGGTAGEAKIVPPENEGGYPEINVLGPTPSYGFFIRHVKGLVVHNLKLNFDYPDFRPPFVLDHVSNLRIQLMSAQKMPDVPLMTLKDVSDLSLISVDGVQDIVAKDFHDGSIR